MKLTARASGLLVMMLLTIQSVHAQQQEQRFSGRFDSASVHSFVRAVEAASGFYFYYDPADTDSIVINRQFVNEPLIDVLNEVFGNTGLRYTIIGSKIYLARGRQLQAELPPCFYPSTQNAIDTFTSISLPDNFTDPVTPTSTLESRLFEIGVRSAGPLTGRATIVGTLRDEKTGEPLPGVSVQVEHLKTGTATDQYGFYSLTLPRGRHVVHFQSLGQRDTKRNILLLSNGKLDVQMKEQILSLSEVIISATKARNVTGVELGVERLNIATIKQVPTIFGESDILRVVLTLPGVKSVGEASTGFNVRGGTTDQNLILFNDATIYNPSHFFGFFSAFNPDVVKDIELYKSSIPSKYGGRLSSVLEINSREGNKKKFTGSAGIGLLTSRFNIEGPLKKDKTSFILGGRTTYSNWLMGLLPGEYSKSSASFYDVNLHIAHEVNKKNSLYFTGYISRDKFSLNTDTAFGYSNRNLSVKWKHEFNNKLNAVFTAGTDQYQYDISSDVNPVNAYKLNFNIRQINLKGDFNYYLNNDHTIDFGVSSIRYILDPGAYRPVGSQSLITEDIIAREHARESAIYIGDRYTISPAVSVNVGIRYSLFNFLGPQEVYTYAPGQPKSSDNIIDVRQYSKGQNIQTYHGPEYRLAARWAITPDFSIKAGYNTLRQYIHMLSNTTAIAPTDIWKLSDANIKPQHGDQVSFGLYKNFKSNTIETSLEVYYKNLRNYLDYKSGASLVMNHDIETDVINTEGKAYGIEAMIKKVAGKFNGWLSYSYSRTLLRQNDPHAGEVINKGNFYPGNYDKPHDGTLVANYRVSHRFSVSLNATYSTGRPITLPVGRYSYGGSQRVVYSDRNEYRIPDYFRTDISINIDGNHKLKQKTHNSWTFGVYNVTGRRNPFSVYYVSENGQINGYKLSIFGNALPFVNFNIRF